jgi:DNA-binding transcriptional ArsR family regulator
MSSTPTRTRGHPQHPSSQQPAIDTAALLDALTDEDCRAILQATSEESLSAGEISEACAIPSSTAYRKVETLTEAGLLSESIRISPAGSHTSEYECAVSNVEIELDDGGVELAVGGDSGRSQPAAAD